MPDPVTPQTPSSPSPSTPPSPAPVGAGPSAESPLTPTPQNPDAPVRPEAFADKNFDRFWDAKDGVKFKELAGELTSLTAFKAEQDLKRASLPAKPEDYKLEMPNGWQAPEGMKFDGFDEKDPRVPAARALAHELGLDQQGFSRLLGVQALHEIGEIQQINNAKAEEVKKLGVNGPARVDAVRTWLGARLGADRGGALLDRLILASDLAAMEDLVKQFSSQGTVQFNQQHREKPSNGISDEAYDKLSPREKLDYARQAGARR